jgi:predicted NBD/HSP70 family sugar kinase
MSLYVGLDIGGTKFMAAAADGHGHVVKTPPQPAPEGLADGLDLLHALVRELTGGARPAGIGAAVGGPLDHETGIVSPLHQPAWRNVPLKALMEQKWGCPCHVDVDTNVAALGEYVLAHETKAQRFLYLTLSTGMGGGFLVDGRVYRGARGAHQEPGHQSIPYRCSHPERISCECGAPDCLEGLVSGNGIRRIYGRPAEQLSDTEWDEVAYNLGQGLRNLAVLYAPELIVLGGGLALGRGERLLAPAREVLRAHLKLVPVPEVRLSRLGYDTALLGAVVMAERGVE